jgi:ATP-binding cassette subfamily G (WHITE) protein 2 (PDR)
VILYWITGLRRTAGAFFFYLLIMFAVLLAMSMFFRTIASMSRTLSQALAPAAVVILGLLIYAGFAISVPNMLGWASWMRYINPVYWGLASLLLNEFSGRQFACSTFVPSGPAYADATGTERVCSVVGAQPGSDTVSGYDYVRLSYEVYNSDRWR